jgi:hypothetical protein
MMKASTEHASGMAIYTGYDPFFVVTMTHKSYYSGVNISLIIVVLLISFVCNLITEGGILEFNLRRSEGR